MFEQVPDKLHVFYVSVVYYISEQCTESGSY